MTPITITHLITTLNPHGAELMLYRLLAGMDRERFQNRVIVLLPEGPVARLIRELDVPVASLNMDRGRPTPVAVQRVVRLLQRERPLALQTWLYHADLLGTLAAKALRLPVLAWNIRGSNLDTRQYRRLTAWTIWLGARLSPLPQAVVVNSMAGLRFHQQIGYRPHRWVLIPNGIDTQLFRPDPAARAAVRQELGLPPESLLIGLVGRFDPQKDQRTFLQAAGLLAPRQPATHFLLVGREVTPDNPALQRLVRECGLAGRAHLLGERHDVPRLTAALDLAASTSAYGEGFSNALGEAMACAVPCVATDVGDSALIVGETGRVVPIRQPRAFADALEALIAQGTEARARLGQAARALIEQRYSLPRIVQRYEALYDGLTWPQRQASE